MKTKLILSICMFALGALTTYLIIHSDRFIEGMKDAFVAIF